MNISIDIRVKDVAFEKQRMTVHLTDGRAITVPLSWFPRLEKASSEALGHWELIAAGRGIHWPALDEDISIEGLLFGQASTEATHPLHP